jgi:hypothetical protein
MTTPLPELDRPNERPPLTSLFGQLADDTVNFARSELRYYQAEVGERTSHALPALVCLAIGAVIGVAAIGALLVGLMMAVAASLGIWLGVTLVSFGAILVAAVLFWVSKRHIKRAFRPLDER